MFDQAAINQLQEGASIGHANAAVIHALAAGRGALALPDHYTTRDIESFLPHRRRARGVMATSNGTDFAGYVRAHKEDGASVFVDDKSMSAVAVLNLGSPEKPGHADNMARYTLKATAAYLALLGVADAQGKTQVKIAEFIEDWQHSITCLDNGEEIATTKAIAAVRRITIETLRKLEVEEQSLRADKSVFESTHATSKEPIPTVISFKCQPYLDLSDRIFNLRLGILTTNDKPAIVLRIIQKERHDELMATELAERVRTLLATDNTAVIVGSYSLHK